MHYIVIANDQPLDTLLKTDFVNAVQRAEMWADHLRRNVTVLSVNGAEVAVAHLVLYTKKA